MVREAEAAAGPGGLGMLVLKGRSVGGGRAVPFRAVAEAIQGAVRDAGWPESGELPAFLPALHRLLDATSPDAPREDSPLLVHEAVLRLLRLLAAKAPGALLVLEDLHWADSDTLALIDYLADHLSAERILAILTLRDNPGPPLDLIEELAGRRVARRLVLGRLSPSATAEMARLALNVREVSGVLLEAVQERSEGVPFLVEEMLTAYIQFGRPSGIPHTYRELVIAALAGLDKQARQVLFAAAVIGRRLELPLLRAVTGLQRDDVLAGLRAAVAARLIVVDPAPSAELPFRFRHALVRETLLAELLPPELEELSGRAAAAIEATHPGLPGEWCERVADLREAAGDQAAAARLLQEAAQRALVRGALTSAETMLEHARELVVQDRWHLVGIDRALADVLVRGGKVDRLREVGARTIAFMEEKRATVIPSIFESGLASLYLRLAEGMESVNDRISRDLYLASARRLARPGPSLLPEQIRLLEAEIALGDGRLEDAVSAATEARSNGERANQPEIVCRSLLVEAQVAFRREDIDSACRILAGALALAGAPGWLRLRALLNLGAVEAAATGDVDRLLEARAAAVRAGAIQTAARAELLIGLTLVRRHDLAVGGESVARAVELAELGRLPLLDEALAAQAEMLVVSGDLRAAARRIEAAGQAAAVARLLLAAATGRPIDLDELADAVGPGLVATGLRACAAGDIATGALQLHGFPWFRHLAWLRATDVAHSGASAEFAAGLTEAMDFFRACGNEELARSCRAHLRSAGAKVRRRGRGRAVVPAKLRTSGVTSREMDVLELVGQGLRNREIAQRLFLSPRTVETHLQSLGRKLEAPSRARLTAIALQLKGD
jgi:DNA-binding CsgD family transcriptional regulator